MGSKGTILLLVVHTLKIVLDKLHKQQAICSEEIQESS